MQLTICAIIICYRHDVSVLNRLIETIRPSVGATLIVNNGGSIQADAVIIQNDRNIGVSAALNQGIEWAKQRGFAHVLFFDQDSAPAPEMVDVLYSALSGMQLKGLPVAAVGPQYIDERTGNIFPFVRWQFPRALKVGAGNAPIECDMLITSGTLVPITVLDGVGNMDASLFIDSIDVEWCARAIYRGYRVYGVPRARMIHKIGTDVHTLSFFGRSKNVIIHSPFRQYYITRNRLLLYPTQHMTWTWVLSDAVTLFLRLIIFMTVIPDRKKNIYFMLLGFWHALGGRRGEMSAPPSATYHNSCQ